MTSRLSPLTLLLLTLLVCLSLATTLKTSADLIGLSIDFQRSHYDFDRCGTPTAGRARRGFGDDYNDGLDFDAGPSVEVAKGEAPWAVAIITKVPGETHPRVCTGTLISRRHVLSAAHCMATADHLPVVHGAIRCSTTDHIDQHDFMDASDVKYGGECLTIKGDTACDEDHLAKTTKIKNITLFPFFYEDCSRGSDLVIFELVQDVDVPHACLPHLHDFEERSGTTLKNAAVFPFHTLAWPGKKFKDGALVGRLQKIALTLRQDRCTHAWKSLSSDVLCVSDRRHIAQCSGESGAGLLTTSSNGRSFLVGVLSASSSCDPTNKQGDTVESRYTDIRLFTATIDRALGTVGPLPDFNAETTTMTSFDALNLTSSEAIETLLEAL